jgi:hypothetical protein
MNCICNGMLSLGHILQGHFSSGEVEICTAEFVHCKWRHFWCQPLEHKGETRISDFPPSAVWYWPSGRMLTFAASEFACKKKMVCVTVPQIAMHTETWFTLD